MADVKNGIVWVRWLVATLWGVLVMVIAFMGNVVHTNDINNRREHQVLEEHSLQRHDAQQKEISKIEEILTDIRIEQRAMGIELKRALFAIEKKL